MGTREDKVRLGFIAIKNIIFKPLVWEKILLFLMLIFSMIFW